VNADAAIKLYSTMFTTVSDVQIYNHPKPRSGGLWNGRKDGMIADKDGHIGIALHWACFDNLVEKFDIQGCAAVMTFLKPELLADVHAGLWSWHNIHTCCDFS